MNATRTAALFCWSAILLGGTSLAQSPANNAATPVSYTSISELNQMIGNLDQASQSAQDDLSHLRIEKWKTDSGTKRQTENDAQSVLRNLQNALPSIVGELKNAPESLPSTFKLYRNLDALYDVMNSLVESAGAFGGKEEFQSLNKDLGAIEEVRRAFAQRMDKLASAKENEIGQLRVELQNARAAIPPKKTVVDDTEPPPPKKTVKKKSVQKPKPANPQGSQASPPAQQ
jgi:DNA repair exonuclease SbcCD ATPase subunit